MCTLRKMVARDICVAAHRRLIRETVRTIDINRPRKIRRVDRSTRSRASLI